MVRRARLKQDCTAARMVKIYFEAVHCFDVIIIDRPDHSGQETLLLMNGVNTSRMG